MLNQQLVDSTIISVMEHTTNYKPYSRTTFNAIDAITEVDPITVLLSGNILT
jgi:hypothetical protein